MKVLHIFNSLMPSGAETMWVAASSMLLRENVETHVLATFSDVGPYAEEMRKAGFTVHHIWHRARHILDLGYCWCLFTLLRKERFDAVQIHPEAWRLTNVIIARMAGVRKVTTTVHSYFHVCGLRRLQRKLRLLLIRALGARVIAIGESVLECEQSYGYRPQLIWNWIDVGRFDSDCSERVEEAMRTRSSWGVPASAKVIIVVGNCAKVKNHEFLFRMAGRLPPDYYVVHVGREDPSLDERTLVRGLGLEQRVLFLGSRADVPNLLAAADVFVMCSHREGLGLACLEALAEGLPAVVSDVPGLRDMRDIPLCAVAPLDEELFAKAVVAQVGLSHQEKVVRAEKSHAIVLSRFSMTENVCQYLEMWK